MAKRSKRVNLLDDAKLELIPNRTKDFYKRYQRDMAIRELSDKTIAGYKNDLEQWFIFILDNQGNLPVDDITDDDLEEYFFWRKEQGNNVNRQKRVMSSISAFYKFLRKKKIIQESPTEFLDRPKTGLPIVKQTYLTSEQVKELKQKLIELGDIQLHTFICFGLSTMARVNAIAHLKWDQVDIEERECDDVLEKEGKIVTLYFSKEVQGLLSELKKYRVVNNIKDYGWVFITPYVDEENCISNGTLNEWCKRAGTLINVPTLHCHDLRHSASSLMKEAGADIMDIAELLHHESTETTIKHYIQSSKKKIKENKDKYTI